MSRFFLRRSRVGSRPNQPWFSLSFAHLSALLVGSCAPQISNQMQPQTAQKAPISPAYVAPSAATAQTILPQPAAEPPGPIRHVVIVTIDGLLPESYLQPEAHRLQIPYLKQLLATGAYSTGADSVFPSLTYPAHTSIATGALPIHHGIFSNLAFDPDDKNYGGWRWYAEDIQTKPLWDIAYAANYRTALVDWPVTVGARATWLVPEFWRARNAEDLKLLRAVSTPGLLEAVRTAYPSFSERFKAQDVQDSAGVDIASYLIERSKPHLLFLHIWQVDGAQHRHGLFSREAKAAIENADAQIGRLLTALQKAGIAEHTALFVASDHGFLPVKRQLRPNALLRTAGLIQLEKNGKISSYRASILTNHGSAYVYLKDPHDAATRSTVTQLFTEKAGRAGSGIGRIFTPEQIRALGGDPHALLALEAENGAYFMPGHDIYDAPPEYVATHGHDPSRAELKASLLIVGPGVKPGPITGARLIDIAPTAAQLLGLPWGPSDGRVLDIFPNSNPMTPAPTATPRPVPSSSVTAPAVPPHVVTP